MPQIPRIQSSQSIPGVSGTVRRDARPRVLDNSGAGLQNAAQGIARAGTGLADFIQRQDEADANTWVSSTTAEAQKVWRERFETSREEAPAGAAGFTPQLMGEYNTWVEETLKAAPNDIAREDAGARFERMGVALFDDAVTFEGTARRVQRSEGFEKGIQDLEAVLFSAPERFAEIAAQANGDLDAADATWMTPTERSRYRNLSGRLAESAMRGIIASDARTAQGMLAPDGPGHAITAALPNARRLVLINSADAAVADLDRADASARAEVELREAALREARVAQLDLAISRGQAGYKEIDALAQAGDLTPAQNTKFLKAVDKRTEEQRELQAGSARVAAALTDGGILLDPKNKDDREHFNAFYDNEVLPGIADLPIDEAFTRISEVVDRAGMVPNAVQSQVRAALRAGDTETKAAAADFVARLAEANPQALDDFAERDVSTAFDIAENLRAGVEPLEAVRLAESLAERPKAEQAELQQRWRDEKQTSGNQSFLADQSDDAAGFFEFDPDLNPGLVGEFNQQQQKYFLLNGGDGEAAQRRAWAGMARVWSVSEVDAGGRRWMKYAPEAFGLAGASRSENAKWIREQMVADVSGVLAEEERGEDLEERIFLAADNVTAREAESGQMPSYVVMVRDPNSGALLPLRQESGAPDRWRPDWKSSAEYKRRIERQRRQRTQAVDKARKTKEFFDKANEISPLPGAPAGEN